ncbi:IS66 family insertion sequence element accessory protein TnpA [Pseudofulvimonas gallinarii]|uniref:IS66 family insertion sequence element accessory protein TnpA n=1 Tax=Pseudofulvimonas gallinarii TaxID=634155 RepID=UPI0035EFED9D
MPSKRTRWAAHMAAWQSSGLSQSAYCRRHALSLASFGYWVSVRSRHLFPRC